MKKFMHEMVRENLNVVLAFVAIMAFVVSIALQKYVFTSLDISETIVTCAIFAILALGAVANDEE